MKTKPNILIFIADQLTWKALPTYGNKYSKTPNIDRIVKKGVTFEQCYTPCPLCQPARASFWTGLLPHETGILSNGKKHYVPELPENIATLGSLFSDNGYETVHFGKKHDAGSLRGFRSEPEEQIIVNGTDAWPVSADTYRDRYTTVKAVEYLNTTGSQPFLMVADLVNPHDICSWVGANKGIHIDTPIDVELPPLPENFRFDDLENRPLPVQYICCSHNRQSQAVGWNDENYRHYLAAYYHYISRVDAEIGIILDALEQREDAKDTLIVFMADHGDGMGAHGLVTKQVSFYDETTRVPFIFAGSGVNNNENVKKEQLVSLLDLVPTLCDYAGIEIPDGLWGKSLVPLLKNKSSESVHSYVVSEWHTEWGITIEPGRMIRSADFKYIRYLEGDGEEFFDLRKDKGETKSLINNADYQKEIDEHRYILKRHLEETKDGFFTLNWEADPKWRNHKIGYHNHVGPAAPMVSKEL